VKEELMRFPRCIVWLVFILLLVPVAYAQLSGQDLKQAKKMVAGTLYLRIDAPCRYGRGSWGLSVEPLLEVSPTGFNVERRLSLPPTKSKVDSVYWGFSPNDAVSYGKISVEGDTVQIWMEGLPPKDDEVMIDFVQIKTLDDFKKAFDLTFSLAPLQDEHPEWPAETRRAIAERRVIAGMTKQQAFCVVGMPINLQTGEENGVKVETWFPRMDRGTVITFRKGKSARTGFPALIKFVDGKVSAIEDTPRSPDLKLER
jgi:hypothetical protein